MNAPLDRFVFTPLAAALACAIGTASAHAGTPPGGHTIVSVTSCADSGAGSLREAVATAPDQAFIEVGALPCSDSTITLTTGALAIADDRNLWITSGIEVRAAHPVRGPQAIVIATIDGGGSDRVIDHPGHGYLYLVGVTLRNGHSQGPGGCLRSAGLVVARDVVVNGCSATATSVDDGSGGGLYVDGLLQLVDSRISGNAADGGSGVAYGGGVSANKLELYATTISDNTALAAAFGFGGGAFARSEAEIYNSTIANNRATTVGGIELLGPDNSGELRIVDSTISGNEGGSTGGVLALQSAAFLESSTIAFNVADAGGGIGGLAVGVGAGLFATIVANNTSPDGAADAGANCINDCTQRIDGTNNLIMQATLPVPADTLTRDPRLAPLADNGGPTPTHALDVLSPALDRVEFALDVDFDQRGAGYARVVGIAADIGAYEYGAGPDRIFADSFDCAAPRTPLAPLVPC